MQLWHVENTRDSTLEDVLPDTDRTLCRVCMYCRLNEEGPKTFGISLEKQDLTWKYDRITLRPIDDLREWIVGSDRRRRQVCSVYNNTRRAFYSYTSSERSHCMADVPP